MILIADSGSTKTDWTLVPDRLVGGSTVAITTQGITPVHQKPDTIRQILEQELMPQIAGYVESLSSVFFYGSGCSPAHIPVMQQLLRETLNLTGGQTPCEAPLTEGLSPCEQVYVASDLMAAARALCGHEQGIACILGTGANSCLYDGEGIVQNTPALGYILGDEGSGAVLGRMFMNAIFKKPAFVEIRDAYLEEQQLTMADVIRRVYREPMANRFLASTSLFIGKHIDNPLLHALVTENFRQFFRCNIVPYGRPELPVHFVGSMASHYQPQLYEAAAAEGFTIGRILKSPMDGLVAYHRG